MIAAATSTVLVFLVILVVVSAVLYRARRYKRYLLLQVRQSKCMNSTGKLISFCKKSHAWICARQGYKPGQLLSSDFPYSMDVVDELEHPLTIYVNCRI